MTGTNTATFDKLTNAVGNFVYEIAERARREQPAIHAAIDAALKSGEFYTNVNIKIFESGVLIRATINQISDETEKAILEEVDGVVQVLQ